MHLIANMPPGRPAKAAGPSAVAYLTSTNSGCLMSLVLRVSDQRLVGGRLIARQLEPTCEAMVRTRLQALATRLSRESSAPSVIGDHIQEAARVLDAVLRRRRPPAECVLSTRTLRIATEILGSNLGRAIHMPEVARACGISEGHLRRAFRTCTGVSPRQWRQERRLQFCRKQLVETDEPLAHIARDAGFIVQSHFSRVFIQSTGMSPVNGGACSKAPQRLGMPHSRNSLSRIRAEEFSHERSRSHA